MKKIFSLLLLVMLISCNERNFIKEYHLNGNLKIKTEIDENGFQNGIHEEYYKDESLKMTTKYEKGIISDTIYSYYQNGMLKEKGLVQGKDLIGWWMYYNEKGDLIRKSEYIIRENSSFLNQNIFFKENGNVDYSLSSFFKLELNDTLRIGKNIGKLKFYSNSEKFKLRFVYVIVENEYDNGIIKKDILQTT